jgi:hypothetical protein
VPSALLTNTIKAANLFAAGGTAAGAISAKAVVLAEGVLKTMLISKLKLMAVVLMAVGFVTASGAGVAYQAKGREQAGATTRQIVKSVPLARGQQEPPKDKKAIDATPPLDQMRIELEALKKQIFSTREELARAQAELLQEQAKNKKPIDPTPKADQTKFDPKINILSLPEMSDRDIEEMMSIIQSTVEPGSWRGGESSGSIECFTSAKLLIVRNRPEVLELVRILVEKMQDSPTAMKRKKIGGRFKRSTPWAISWTKTEPGSYPSSSIPLIRKVGLAVPAVV